MYTVLRLDDKFITLKIVYKGCSKIVPPILLYSPTMTEADVGSTAVEAQPSHQCSILFCCHIL